MSDPILVKNNLDNFTSLVTAGLGWQTVDLAPYLEHDDPKMVIIIMMMGIGAGTKFVGCKPVGSTLIDKYTVFNNTAGIQQFPCSLAGGTTIQVYAPASLTGVNYFIHAEIGGDDAIIPDDPVLVNPAGAQEAWYTVDATARLGSDAGKVVASILLIHHEPSSVYNFRSFGSTDTFLPASSAWGNHFGICGLDIQNRYQVYKSRSAGKSPVDDSFYFEAGYIRSKWNHIVDPVDRNLTVPATWTNEDITDATEGVASIAQIRYYHLSGSGARQAWMRHPSAIFQGPLWIQLTFAMQCLVNLTSEQVYQYYITDAAIHQYILGWYAKPTNILTVDRGALTIDRGTLTVG